MRNQIDWQGSIEKRESIVETVAASVAFIIVVFIWLLFFSAL